MHTLFLASYYPNRVRKTVGIFIQRHAKAIVGKVNITVLAIERDESLMPTYEIVRYEENGCPVFMIYYRSIKSGIPILGTLRTFFLRFRAMLEGVKMVRKERGEFGLVHLNISYSMGLLATYLKFFKRKPYLLTEHSSSFLNDNIKTVSKYKLALIRFIFRFSSGLSTVSDHLGKSIVRLGLSKQYKVIPNIVPIELFTLAQRRPKTQLSFLHVSNLIPLKGCEQMLMACKRLIDQQIEFKFTIIGGSGPILSKLKEMADDLKLGNYVEFTGELSAIEVSAYMQVADFLLMNSEFETFSIVMMEAMACGLPVVAPDNTAFSENINEERGILMEDRSAESIEQAICQMMETKDRYNPVLIRNYVADKFTEESVANKFVEFYNSVNTTKLS